MVRLCHYDPSARANASRTAKEVCQAYEELAAASQRQELPLEGDAGPPVLPAPIGGCLDASDQPKSARFTALRCRPTQPGDGGDPRAGKRPASAPFDRRKSGHKTTEKWRETGMLRWPQHLEEELCRRPHQFEKAEETVPVRRSLPNAQPEWTSELWTRSLREKGVPLENQIFGQIGHHKIRSLHQDFVRRPVYGRMGYSGETATGSYAIPRNKDTKLWIEKPVANGKMASEHMGGTRYKFRNDRDASGSKMPVPGPRTGDILDGWTCPGT